MAHRVVFAPEAFADLHNLYDRIADAAPPARALAYVEGLRRYCLSLAAFPERGRRRDAIRPGLRTLGYRRRVTVALQVTGTQVMIILRLLYAAATSRACCARTTMNDIGEPVVDGALRTLWRQGVVDVEVLRSEFDAHGYDLVMAHGRIVRHIQFKTGTTQKPGQVSVSQALTKAERLRDLDPG